MSYYITAKKGKSRINVPVEDKVLNYNHYDQMYSSPYNTTSFAGYQPQDFNFAIIVDSNEFRNDFTRGIGSDEFQGDKIFVNSVYFDMTVTMSPEIYRSNYIYRNILNDDVSTSDEIKYVSPFLYANPVHMSDYYSAYRFMIIHFEDNIEKVMFNTEGQHTIKECLAKWFNSVYDYQYKSGSVELRSCQSALMIPNNDYIGKFTIIYDKPFNLTPKKNHKHLTYTWLIKKNVNIEVQQGANTGTITNNVMKNTYFFIIGPTNNALDFDAGTATMLSTLSQQKKYYFVGSNDETPEHVQESATFSYLQNQIQNAYVYTTMRLKYYDI